MPRKFAAHLCQKPTIDKFRSCSNCGQLGHLQNTCENPEAHHNMIGVEIEGWWFDLPGMQEKARQLTDQLGNEDGSLLRISSCLGEDDGRDLDLAGDEADCEHGCDDCPHPIERTGPVTCSNKKKGCKTCGARSWEFKTKPGSVGQALNQLTKLYPDVTSRAAGMHVHISFKDPTSVTLLCSQKFFDYWKTRWEAWGTKSNIKGAFWERLRAENEYCQPATMNEFQGKMEVTKGGHKYRQVNFKPFTEIGTVEFRLLPMFQKGDLAVRAIEQLVDIVESYLQQANIDKDIEATAKITNSADVPVEIAKFDDEIPLPPTDIPIISGEVDIYSEKVAMGPIKDDKGNQVGVRMFQYQVDSYYATMAQEATKIKQKIADPKAHKVKWENFDTTPKGRV